jgi:hypothetical protein
MHLFFQISQSPNTSSTYISSKKRGLSDMSKQIIELRRKLSLQSMILKEFVILAEAGIQCFKSQKLSGLDPPVKPEDDKP